jgi:membrane fusion protein, multidrug efflux system
MLGFVDGKRWVSQRQEVKLGIRRSGRVEITEGLVETDIVVVAGQQRLQRDNTPVRVIELGRASGGPAGGAPISLSGASNAAPAMGSSATGNIGGAASVASPAQAAASR